MAANAPKPLIGGEEWGEMWPRVERHLLRVLRRKAPAGLDLADVVQETATRLWSSGAYLETEVDVLRYATRIGKNLLKDHLRRSRLIAFQPLVRDMASSQDVEGEVMSRAELAALHREAAAGRIDLSAFAEDSGESPAGSSAVKSRRYRVRKRLDRWAGGLVLSRLRWLLGGLAATATLAPAAVPGVFDWPSEVLAPPSQKSVALPHPVPPEEALSETGAPPTQLPLVQAGTTAARQTAEAPTYRSDLKVSGPAWTGAETGGREYPPGTEPEHVVCIRRISPLDDVCAPHPLR